jgi:glutathione S-transferase
MARTTLTISSRNYSAWSLRGWLLTKFSGLEFEEIVVPPADPTVRAELLLLSPSILVPCLEHEGVRVWDTMAIAEYLHEVRPEAGLLPADRVARAHCRSICGEMHSGFGALRSALPMNLRGHCPGFKVIGQKPGDNRRVHRIGHASCAEQTRSSIRRQAVAPNGGDPVDVALRALPDRATG